VFGHFCLSSGEPSHILPAHLSPNRLASVAERRIFATMNAIQIVAATPDGKNKLEYWAVTAPPQTALVEVLQRVPAGWMVTLTGETLNPQEAAALDLRPFEVRKLGHRNSRTNSEGTADF
jgi:hypothetical protein